MPSDATTVRSGRKPAPADPGTPRIWGTAGSGEGEVWELTEGEWIIGKADDAAIQLTDSGVSRRHAKIVRSSDGMVIVVDLGSTNGTWVDDKRIEVATLREGARIGIGPDAELRFGSTAAPAQPSAVTVDNPLTDRELQIARCVAEGLTNRQIAERLDISVKTVSSHLDNIYARLQVSSRVALTRWLFTAGLAEP